MKVPVTKDLRLSLTRQRVVEEERTLPNCRDNTDCEVLVGPFGDKALIQGRSDGCVLGDFSGK